MIRNIFYLIGLILAIGCYKSLSENDLLQKDNPIGSYGSKIKDSEVLSISTLLESPNEYLGDIVLISGYITEVCPMRGCWIDVMEANTESNIRVKVVDGKIVFPLSAVGNNVNVQGEFVKLEFSREQAINWKVHLAEEKGLVLNRQDVVLKDEDLIEFRINGQSALIY